LYYSWDFHPDFRYSTVGVMEQFNTSLVVLENLLPGKIIWFNVLVIWVVKGFFGCARELMSTIKSSQRNKNPHPKLKEEVKKIMQERRKLDLEFYEFVKQRLAVQFKTLNIKDNIL
jgi:hypothetical protein